MEHQLPVFHFFYSLSLLLLFNELVFVENDKELSIRWAFSVWRWQQRSIPSGRTSERLAFGVYSTGTVKTTVALASNS
jgi:hypothetical protein